MNKTIATATLLAAACAAEAPAPVGAPDPRALDREAALGVTRVYVDHDHFTLALPADLDTPARRVANGVVWRYDGQERFADYADPIVPVWVYDAPEPRRPLHEQLLGSVSVDAYGRRWVAESIDEAGLADALAAYDTEVAATVGLEAPETLATDADLQTAAGDGAWRVFTPQTWHTPDCNSDGDNDISRWDADDRSVSANPMSDRQAKVLIISSPRGGCSATMVDDEWMLTAAHCVTTSSGTRYADTSVKACTLGNYQAGAQCFDSLDIIVASGYSGDGDINDDYAVVKLDGRPGVGWMAISQASNSTIKAADGYQIGYPGFRPGCSANSASAINAGYPANTQYWNKGDVFDLTANKIKTRIDTAGGHSGGPHFYYPSGCCGSHYLTGVHSGYYTVALGNNYTGGAKGPAIRSWVVANTP